jgi:hypothetical protein
VEKVRLPFRAPWTQKFAQNDTAVAPLNKNLKDNIFTLSQPIFPILLKNKKIF